MLDEFEMKIIAIQFLLATLCHDATSANRTSFLFVDEVRTLSELPLEELMQIKCVLQSEEDGMENEEEEELSSRSFPLSLPVAEPLKRYNKKSISRYEDNYDEKGKDTKISKIFQLSVTALSFLAFGGYLLTLIITAIRQNASNNSNGNLIVLSNLQALQNYNRPKRNVPIEDPTANGIDVEIEKLYQGMILLSKSYAMYK